MQANFAACISVYCSEFSLVKLDLRELQFAVGTD
jgi:hypothetical protein